MRAPCDSNTRTEPMTNASVRPLQRPTETPQCPLPSSVYSLARSYGASAVRPERVDDGLGCTWAGSPDYRELHKYLHRFVKLEVEEVGTPKFRLLLGSTLSRRVPRKIKHSAPVSAAGRPVGNYPFVSFFPPAPRLPHRPRIPSTPWLQLPTATRPRRSWTSQSTTSRPTPTGSTRNAAIRGWCT